MMELSYECFQSGVLSVINVLGKVFVNLFKFHVTVFPMQLTYKVLYILIFTKIFGLCLLSFNVLCLPIQLCIQVKFVILFALLESTKVFDGCSFSILLLEGTTLFKLST